MICQDTTIPKDEQRSMIIGNDSEISIISSYEPLISPLLTYFFFKTIPLWIDLLPGRYNLICQMRLRRHVRKPFIIDLFDVALSIKVEKKKSY